MRLSLQQKEQFFHEMSELVRSGKTVAEALEMIEASRSAPMRETASAMRRVGEGSTAENFFAAVPSAFTSLDCEVVGGGETSGRLDEAMGYLSEYYASMARARRRMIQGAVYPFFLLHFAALMLALPALFGEGGMEAFVMQALGFLVIFYVLFALAWMALSAAIRAAGTNPAADRILQSIPGLGGARVALISSRFCLLMGFLVKASGGILSAMTRAATASGSALFEQGATQAVAAVQGGGALGSSVARTHAFPEPIDRAFQVGEASGRLDQEMTRQAARYTELLNSRLEMLAGGTAKTMGVIIMLVVAVRVVMFYVNYYASLAQIGG
jgi:type II secretory pathway component PulF